MVLLFLTLCFLKKYKYFYYYFYNLGRLDFTCRHSSRLKIITAIEIEGKESDF